MYRPALMHAHRLVPWRSAVSSTRCVVCCVWCVQVHACEQSGGTAVRELLLSVSGFVSRMLSVFGFPPASRLALDEAVLSVSGAGAAGESAAPASGAAVSAVESAADSARRHKVLEAFVQFRQSVRTTAIEHGSPPLSTRTHLLLFASSSLRPASTAPPPLPEFAWAEICTVAILWHFDSTEAGSKKLLLLCDQLRDSVFPSLDVALSVRLFCAHPLLAHTRLNSLFVFGLSGHKGSRLSVARDASG
jgi:hypothetical protein